MKGTKVTHIKLSSLIRRNNRRRSPQSSTEGGETQEESVEEAGSLSGSTSESAAQNTCEQLIPNLTFVAKQDEAEPTPPPIAPRRYFPSSSNTQTSSPDKRSKNSLNDLKKSRSFPSPSSTQSNITSFDMDDSKKSTSAEISIEEDIEEVIPSASSTNSSAKSSPKKLDKVAAIKKRNLFDIEAGSKFSIDDDPLSGEGIAQHFFQLDEMNEVKKSPKKSEKSKSFDVGNTSKVKLLDVPKKTRSIEEANESMPMKLLQQQLSQSSPQSISQPQLSSEQIPKGKLSQRTSSENKSELETSSVSNKSDAQTVSQIRSSSDVSRIEKTPEIAVQQPSIAKSSSHHEGKNDTEMDVGAPNESLTNQSTANDVSEIIEELSNDEKAQSLDLSSKYINFDKQTSHSADISSSLPDLPMENPTTVVAETSYSETLMNDAEISNELIKNMNDDTKDNTSVRQTRDAVEITIDDSNLSDPSFDVHDLSKVNRYLNDTLPAAPADETAKNSFSSLVSTSQEDDMDALKEKILSIKLMPKSGAAGPHMARDVSYEQTDDQHIAIKQMEKVQVDFSKDILEDITEESEKISSSLMPSHQNLENANNTSNDFDSIVSLNMIQMLENKVKDLQDVVSAKDICLNALNMQLDATQRRESYATLESFRDSYDKQPPSGRDSSSLATNSTEYRGLQEELGNKIFDFHAEIAQRDQLIEKLTDSLQQTIQNREHHQNQIDKLNAELQVLRKQMADLNRKPSLPIWPNRVDQESNGQRLSEISIDLVSESDDDLERHYLTDNEERQSRQSRERQLSIDMGQSAQGVELFDQQPGSQMSISKQIEQFQKYLNPEELRIFFMVQKKFDDFLSQEIAKAKAKYDGETKIMIDQMEAEKHDKDLEITRLKQLLTSVKNGSSELIKLRQELDEIHSKEMEDLRTYFEKKCADLEKQYSEEIFSQRNDVQSDISDQENLPHDDSPRRRNSLQNRLKEGSPRKKTREELYSSPSHRQMTPTGISPERNQRKSSLIEDKIKQEKPEISTDELETFYKEKIQELNHNHEKIVKNLNEKLKRFESKYADDEFMPKSDQITAASIDKQNSSIAKPYAHEDQMSSYIIIDEDEMVDEGNEIAKIAAEYERRLVEQVQLAKEDIIKELEHQIQALLSETSSEDHHWPPELILLREKFTAKSQLEIAQLQIKHEEEMGRLKAKYEKQLNRKIKRQSTFDLSRDLDQILNERDGLRDLSLAFRHVTSELAKCVSLCEDDLNITFLEELHRLSMSQQGQQQSDAINMMYQVNETGDNLDNSMLNDTTLKRSLLETTLQKRIVPDVTSLLNVVDDPKLLSYISQNPNPNVTKSPSTIPHSDNFNLKDCIEKLKNEAQMLLELSENVCQRKHLHESDILLEDEKNDACEEDGLRSTKSPKKMLRASSMNENMLRPISENKMNTLTHMSSLPPDLNKVIQFEVNIDDYTSSGGGPTSELNYQVNELRNRLVKSEGDKIKLQQELEATIKRNSELGVELNALRDQLEHLDSNREDFSEGYGIGEIKSPQRMRNLKNSSSFIQLQEKARNMLGTPRKSTDGDSLLQIIEDFCREGDKVMEDGKNDRDDLQAQIDAADKQLKATRLFLEEQAAERELERDEFVKEIEKLKNLLRDKDKERTSLQNVSNENMKIPPKFGSAERMEHQIKELNSRIDEYEAKKDKLEVELKASIDKIFVLREIISDLETQVETKALNEHVLNEKVKELESYTNEQNHSVELLQQEIEVLKNEIGQGYQNRIVLLEDALRNSRPSNEQSAMLRQFGEQLRDIAITLEQKTKVLESLHQSVASISCSETPREDVSVQDRKKSSSIEKQSLSGEESSKGSPVHIPTASPRINSLPIEEIEIVFERLSKHTRVEEAAIKRIKDLEMHNNITKSALGELQQERDVLQEKMSEQMVRISSLQTKLDEQKRRAEELQRNGSSDLNTRIYDLQNDVQNLTESLTSRDKQISNLKNHLEQSKNIIDRQEAELAMGGNSDRSLVEKLENELKQKMEENKKLREKIKSEMINKLALPDLMETMLADKNEEIDQLREQLEAKDRELQNVLEMHSINHSSKDKSNSDNGAGEAKLSARTLSDIVSISEFDEPDIIRKAIPQHNASPLVLQPPQPSDSQYPEQTMNTSKMGLANLTEKRTDDLTVFNSLQQPPTFNQPNFFATDPSIPSNLSSVPSFAPRHINFSEFVDESKLKESTPKHNSDSNNNSKENDEEQKSIKRRLSSAHDEITELKLSLERLSKEKTDAVQHLQNELDAKVKTVKELNDEKIKLANQLADFDTRIERSIEIEKQVRTKEDNFKQLENEFIQLQLQLGRCQDCLDEKTKDIDNLQKQISDLEIQNSGLKTEIEDLQKLKSAAQEIEKLSAEIEKLSAENTGLQTKLDELNALNFTDTIAVLNNQIDILKETVHDKDEILQKFEERFFDFEEKLKLSKEREQELENQISDLSRKNIDFIDFEKLTEELNATRSNLAEKSLLYEKSVLDVKTLQSEIEKLKDNLQQKEVIIENLNTNSENKKNVTEIQQKLTAEKARNLDLEKRLSGLESELEKVRTLQTSESSNKQLTLDEIARQVEKELNYSAQLDSNILKAIESEEENNLNVKTDSAKLMERDLLSQLQSIKDELEDHKRNSAQIHRKLEDEQKSCKLIKEEFNVLKAHSDKIAEQLREEKTHSAEIQQQDSDIIEAMRIRLEEALEKENELHQLIDEEREKCNRLTTQISTLQQTEARRASFLLRSPPESPRKSPPSPDFEQNVVRRLKGEIELLTSQNKRERERMADLQKLFEREKSRFEGELKDHIEFGEDLKSKLERLIKDKDSAEQEIDHLKEHSMLQAQEIESLTKRVVSLQEAETRRLQRRDKERSESTQNLVDLQEMKSKLQKLEVERDLLNQTIELLRSDVDRSAKREAKLAEALSSQSPDATIPQEFLVKMKEMNVLLKENMKELMDERKALQRKCEDLENQLASSGSNTAANSNVELTERTNQLLGRLLRVESHRKALVHQKRYLMISLQSYQESEAKAMALINGSDSLYNPRRNLFKSVALVIIAIQRMKFIAKRWQTGKRIVSKSVFTITHQKRAPVNAVNYQYNVAPISLSPPCRDTNPPNPPPIASAIQLHTPPFQLQSPNLITECVTKQPQLHHHHPHQHLHQHHQQLQPQKFDWSRLKK